MKEIGKRDEWGGKEKNGFFTSNFIYDLASFGRAPCWTNNQQRKFMHLYCGLFVLVGPFQSNFRIGFLDAHQAPE